MFSGISNVRIFVHNWRESVAFYRDVIGLPLAFVSETPPYAGFMAGSVTLMLEPGGDEHGELVGRFTGISLATEDIATEYQRLIDGGVEFLHAPEKQAWGALLTHFKDPSGNVITVVEYRSSVT
jgi:catechol 2,3-dioxygenase-like lactoylglutathione lyase family enzyme